jgi:hypothetical protein
LEPKNPPRAKKCMGWCFQGFEAVSRKGTNETVQVVCFRVLSRFLARAKNNTAEMVFSMFQIVFPRRQKTTQLKVCFQCFEVFSGADKTTQLKLHLQCFESVGKAHSVEIVFAGVFGAVSKNTENELLCSVRLVCFWSPDFSVPLDMASRIPFPPTHVKQI